MSASFGAMRVGGLPVRLLCEQVSLIGVLESLPGDFMSGQVIFFAVVLGACPMGMGSEVPVFGSYVL